MKKFLLFGLLVVSSFGVFASTITVTPATFVATYNSAADGDILLLDEGTYSTAVDFPVGKTITLQKLPTAASTPILLFSLTKTVAPTAGSSLILDGLDIDVNGGQYFIDFPVCTVDRFILKNCILHKFSRSFIRANAAGTTINEVTLDNCTITDAGYSGYCIVYTRQIINSVTVKNSTIYNYMGEGLFYAQTNDQTHTFTFNMQNNTIYQSGRDGAFGWCILTVNYASTSTYNISNNIFNKPYNTSDTRTTIVVPAGSGTVTCSNNLVVDYPNFSLPPASGWVLSNTFESTINFFKDTTNRDFTLDCTCPYKGTDNNYLGAPRWWPLPGACPVFTKNATKTQLNVSVNNGMIKLVSNDVIGSVEIYNMKGIQLFAKKINTTETVINASSFSEGIYMLTAKSNNKIISKKIALIK